MGEFVGLADDEILEGEALIERRELRLVFADFERAAGLGEGRAGAERISVSPSPAAEWSSPLRLWAAATTTERR